jgi:hypothetical protein
MNRQEIDTAKAIPPKSGRKPLLFLDPAIGKLSQMPRKRRGFSYGQQTVKQ